MENKTDVYAPLGDKRKKFMSWQARTILVTMIGQDTIESILPCIC